MSLKQFLEQNKKIVDKEIEKIIPKKANKKWLVKTLGKADYSYDIKTIQKAMIEPIWDFIDRGGKRWRPALLLLSCLAVGGTRKQAIPFMALPELVHSGTIMVDDVQDRAEIRRGKKATHLIYGEDIAINDSNAMYFLPMVLLYRNTEKLTSKQKALIYDVYSEEMVRVSVGQAMDIFWHNGKKQDVSESDYLQMCSYKTGVLARMSTKIGGILGNANKKQINALGKFGEAIGVGFQIKDDILNLRPEDKSWGKHLGEDISEGKRTILTIYAMNNSSKKDANELKKILNKQTKNKTKIKRAIKIIETSGAFEYGEKKAEQIVLDAWKNVEKSLPENKAKKQLKEFAEYLVDRLI